MLFSVCVLVILAVFWFLSVESRIRDLEETTAKLTKLISGYGNLVGGLIDTNAARTMKEQGIPGTTQDLWRAAGLELPNGIDKNKEGK